MKRLINWGSDEDFISNYKKLKSSKKVSELYKVNKKSVLKHAKSIGFDVNSIERDYKLSEEDKKYIIDNYNNKTSSELAEELKVSRGIITNLWYREKLKNKNKNTYKILKEDFFEKIDSDEKAYWLGFIMADGNVGSFNDNRQPTINIGLALKDIDHLEKFKEAIGTKKPINKDGSKTNKLQISSLKMYNDLVKLGCLERKTYENTWVKLETPELQFSFIRGYFDGDGSINPQNFNENNLYKVSVSIVGYKETLDYFMEFLQTYNIKCSFIEDKRKYNGGTFGNLIISNKKSKYIFLTKIYPNELTYYLDRKFLLANKFIEYYEKNPVSWEINNTNADNKSSKIGES